MGWPRVRCGWTCINCASGLIFWLSLLGLAVGCGLAGWAYELKLHLADLVDVALPGGEGYLWPGALAAGVVLTAPVHLLGVGLRAPVARDITSRKLDRSTSHGKCLDRLLVLHVALSCLSGLLVFGACAGSAFLWSYSRRRVKQGLYRALRRYPYDATTRARVDLLQLELHCCGVESYTDWFTIPWSDKSGASVEKDTRFDEDHLRNRKSIHRRQRRRLIGERRYDVPYSCCSSETSPCVHLGVGADRHPTKGRWSISSRGCHAQMLDQAEAAGRQVVTCLFFLSIYQLTVSIVSRLLQTARASAARTHTRGELFSAWIFGGSPPSDDRRSANEMQPLRDEDEDEDDSTSSTEYSGRRLVAGGGNEPPPDQRFRDISRQLAVGPHMQTRKQQKETSRDVAARTKRSPGGERRSKPNDAHGRFRDSFQDTVAGRENRSARHAGKNDWRPVDKRKACARRTSSSASAYSSSGSSSLPTLPATPGPARWSGRQCCPVHPHPARRIAPDCPVHGDASRRSRR